MLKAYKYRMYLNNKQALVFNKHFGRDRFIFINWMLGLQNRYYKIFCKGLLHTQIQSQFVRKRKRLNLHG
ncbi:helix-turn-helix domain-containing protein [Moraxella lincolnii]|uniref:Transposase putative helix-turn-helix domain-containing protein n=1 Tax=Lwoffella lincolnii TaxID=90241 RepID=A0A1T0CG60_9GAMM|nr:hypothetical protein B0682_05075 [Moraxella lincolnii]